MKTINLFESKKWLIFKMMFTSILLFIPAIINLVILIVTIQYLLNNNPSSNFIYVWCVITMIMLLVSLFFCFMLSTITTVVNSVFDFVTDSLFLTLFPYYLVCCVFHFILCVLLLDCMI